MHRCLTYLFLMILGTTALAQEVEMAEGFRADGKIYVVIAVILILLAGLFVYIFRIERKLKKLEKQ